MGRYYCEITRSLLRGVWVLHTLCVLLWVGVCVQLYVYTGYLRSAVDAQGAHPVHSHLTDIHTLGVDLNTTALEVLLVIHTHLESLGKEKRKERE